MTPCAVAILCVWLLAGVLAGGAADAKRDARPNLVFVMADDLNQDWEQDRHALMPNLKREFVDNGLEFINHVAASPVCGPSRSSLLAGRYAHNVGYVANTAKASIEAWEKQQNQTFGQWATAAGYYTAFLGKYVNGMECDTPSGFRHWGGLTCSNLKRFGPHHPVGGTYNYYNASQWQVDFDESGEHVLSPPAYKIWHGVHQAEFLANATVQQAHKAVQEGRPFLIHVTPVMVHAGTCYGPQPIQDYAPDDPFFERTLYDPDVNSHGQVKGKRKIPISPCPSVKHKHDFDGLKNPHFPSWNQSATGGTPQWIQDRGNIDLAGCCDEFDVERQHKGFRNRTAAVVDLDDLIGTIFQGLRDLNVLDNTYVIFTSDNGYHLGEHHLLFGKTEPYDTDIRLPMYVRGPGVATGVRPHPTNHIDIAATMVELLGLQATAPSNLDGLSFAPVLSSSPPTVEAWRGFSFSEFYVNNNTWLAIRVITNGAVDFKLHWWCSDQSEVFHIAEDPWELQNHGGTSPSPYGQAVVDKYLPYLIHLSKCSGAGCHQLIPAPGVSPQSHPLPCHNAGPNLDVIEAVLDPNF